MSSSEGGSIVGTVGCILAALTSWLKWHSVFLCIVHGLFSWFYVIYYVCEYGIPKW